MMCTTDFEVFSLEATLYFAFYFTYTDFMKFFENIKRKFEQGNKIDFGKSNYENELQEYNEELRKIEQYRKKISA